MGILNLAYKYTNFPIKLEETKGLNKNRQSKKDRKYKSDKRTNNDLQNITQKTKNHRAIRTPLNTGMKSGAPEG